jgi:hypothetical protein
MAGQYAAEDVASGRFVQVDNKSKRVRRENQLFLK